MPYILKINMRDSTTGSAVRFMRDITNNFSLNKRFNSLASTFAFDFKFDPKNQEHAEMICVTHLHECWLYYTTNTDHKYQPKDTELEFTGLMMYTKLKHGEEPEWVRISGYSKSGILNDSDWPHDLPTEMEGLSLGGIIKKVVPKFGLNVIIQDDGPAAERAPSIATDTDAIGKTSVDSIENIGSYLSGIARVRNVVLSHNAKGDVVIKKPNTKGKPVLTLDFTDKTSDASKIPGITAELEFNGQAMHSQIIVRQEASDNEDSNGVETKPLKNPLLPVGAVYRPKIYNLTSGSEFSAEEYAKYELGREIREAVKLVITAPLIHFDGKLISPDNTISVRDPSIFLYNLCNWYIEAIDYSASDDEETCTLQCVLPYTYDFDGANLENVFVDPHKNFPLSK